MAALAVAGIRSAPSFTFSSQIVVVAAAEVVIITTVAAGSVLKAADRTVDTTTTQLVAVTASTVDKLAAWVLPLHRR